MAEDLPEGTEITCPLCRGETATVKRNKQDKPYFYCAEYEAAVNMNAPVAHTEAFLRQFTDGETSGAAGPSDAAGAAGAAGSTGPGDSTDSAGRSDSTDITTRE